MLPEEAYFSVQETLTSPPDWTEWSNYSSAPPGFPQNTRAKGLLPCSHGKNSRQNNRPGRLSAYGRLLFVETSSGAELAASDARLLTLAIAMLIAVLCSALTEAVSMPTGILAFRHTARRRSSFPAALAFVPLALYDCTRCVHRADVFAFLGRARPLIAIVAYLMRATMPPRFRRHRFFALRPRPAFSRFARAQRSPASASPGARGTRWPPRRFHFRKRNRNLRDSLDKCRQ